MLFIVAGQTSPILFSAVKMPLGAPVYNFQGPVVTGISLLTGGSTTSASALPLRIAGGLMIDLSASAYDPVKYVWDNKATNGPISYQNGDFGVVPLTGGQTNNPPTLQTINNVTAVVFTFDSGQSLSTLSTPSQSGNGVAPATLFSGMWGGSTWTLEALVYPIQPDLYSKANEVNTESPFFQWGNRPAPTCQGGFLSVGHHPIWGAGGHFNCDIYWSGGPSVVQIEDGAVTGYRPTPNQWHHLVSTYTGNPNPNPALAPVPGGSTLMSVFIDGQLSTAVPRSLSIVASTYIHIGSWFNTAGGTTGGSVTLAQQASCGIAMFRAHTGVLSAADVAYNYAQLSATLLASGAVGFGAPSANVMSLATAGFQQLMLTGYNFNPPSVGASGPLNTGTTVSYTAVSPLSPNQTILYPAGLDTSRSNSTNLVSGTYACRSRHNRSSGWCLCDAPPTPTPIPPHAQPRLQVIITSPGVGPSISFIITAASGPEGTTLPPVVAQTAPIAAYAAPAISAFSPLGTWAPGPTASANGGDNFALTGTSFGPLTLPGIPQYMPVVKYAKPSGGFLAVNCARSATSPQTILTCQTAPGAGKGWILYVCAGQSGQCSTPSGATPPSISYAAPVITSIFGALMMNTAGGESLVALGTGFGSPSTIGQYTVLLQYGPAALAAAGTWLYNGTLCTLASVSSSSMAMQIGCETVPGIGGTGFVARVVVGDTPSNTLAGTGLGFAAPVLQNIVGPGAVSGSTAGNQVVNITGINFGYSTAVLNVTYSLQLQGPVPGVTTVGLGGSFSPNTVNYKPLSCAITIPHTQITCLTTAGAGTDMWWTVVVNGVENAYPTSSYAAPIVTSYQLLDGAGGAQPAPSRTSPTQMRMRRF